MTHLEPPHNWTAVTTGPVADNTVLTNDGTSWVSWTIRGVKEDGLRDLIKVNGAEVTIDPNIQIKNLAALSLDDLRHLSVLINHAIDAKTYEGLWAGDPNADQAKVAEAGIQL